MTRVNYQEFPTYRHDCESCIYLGSYESSHYRTDNKQVLYDLYYCPGKSGGSIIARDGDKDPSYHSFPLDTLLDSHLRGTLMPKTNPLMMGLLEALRHGLVSIGFRKNIKGIESYKKLMEV